MCGIEQILWVMFTYRLPRYSLPSLQGSMSSLQAAPHLVRKAVVPTPKPKTVALASLCSVSSRLCMPAEATSTGRKMSHDWWGGFSADNATLNRFSSLQYVSPFLIAGWSSLLCPGRARSASLNSSMMLTSTVTHFKQTSGLKRMGKPIQAGARSPCRKIPAAILTLTCSWEAALRWELHEGPLAWRTPDLSTESLA